MIIVTGGAGFIGSNVVGALNARGIDQILVVDDLTDGRKVQNLSRLRIADYCDKDDFLQLLQAGKFDSAGIETIFHLGACASTTELNGRFLMKTNYEYSKIILEWALKCNVQMIYASSASVYGTGEKGFSEDLRCEHPINPYAYSKYLFDQRVRQYLGQTQTPIVGMRYFNVYGSGEDHKDNMASTALQLYKQLLQTGELRLFEGTDGFANGEQKRDFISVEDCASVNLWFFENKKKSGIFNVGTGYAASFNELAKAVISAHGSGKISYVPFPGHLRGRYQSYTCADLNQLRAVGYDQPFMSVQEGVGRYIQALKSSFSG